MRRSALLLAGAGAMLCTPAVAQVRDLDDENSDVRVFQGEVDGAASVFNLTVPADTALQIDAVAKGDLDPVLRVLDASTGELIVEDDDGGGELNSRARIGAQETSRRIAIEVDSFDAEWVEGESYGGPFELRISLIDSVAVGTRAVDYGARETGNLMGDEHLFTIAGEAGQMVEIALVAVGENLDPYLELRDASGEVVASDDDGGENLNSLLRHMFTDSGTYTIAASSYGEDGGEYRLRVRERRAISAQLPLQVIGIDDEAGGELASGWDETGSGTMMPNHIDYQLSEDAKAAIRRGSGEVSIRMTASGVGDPDFGGEIDPFIELGFDTPLGFAVVDSDDDGGGELDAMLPVDLGLIADEPALLDALRIRAQGYGGSSGSYTLVITEGMEQRADAGWHGGD
ncbi:hypothetical protein [Aurantiacibacter hainanensis]|uniref:hypothetical protein n=1 Tax=Aurantiacibacter hainanensis TaxID=3076114 RepID=UPI0030C6B3BC